MAKDQSGKMRTAKGEKDGRSIRSHIIEGVTDIASEGAAGVRYQRRKLFNDKDIRRAQEEVKETRRKKEDKYM